ncbi:sigma-54-dependent Fis family transcriptional regulator [Betaproteobacteria bacterium SCN1]|jgi:DNA-binding NtrC family response regulator|nr:sigma-54-dependent Fis family transcriptional regulator [Betaproteobacteria bacterium SCN1]MBN8760621.1 sigma-54-dependent Fis family transcriptional regulator [Thiobacillus sp.]
MKGNPQHTEKSAGGVAVQAEALPTILITEDDRNMRELMLTVLAESSMTFRIAGAENANEAMAFLENNEVAVVVTDLRMPGADGLDLLKFAKARDPLTQVVLVTGYATVESAVAALKDGAYDYVQKPFDIVKLRCVVEKALGYWLLSTENQRLRQQRRAYEDGGEIIGQSQGKEQVDRLIDAAAAYDSSVLIFGESGSGKELVARQIHLRGKRAERPFVAINCAAIPENLIESELFGFRKGAFTGAERNKPGLFEVANGGTLFLDEINNAPMALQAKLLRVLQDGNFYPTGATEPVHVDVRVVAASNRPMNELVEQQLFREDLFYRLSVMEIAIPPLRERREDIALLTYYFLNKHALRLSKHIAGVSTAVLGALMRYDWPGNVRELENVVQRMIILTESEHIDADVLPAKLSEQRDQRSRALDYLPPQSLEEIEAYFIRKTLRETRGDRALAADILGIDKSTLWRKVKRYGIEE